ncbi:SxtJ family membrane protein [Thalassospira sp. CH_XMU1448-2]|uniref:SxtJ family membrane protein n=1 Tax=Thalassospira sp. CH_XMU1448-2 TaxID=3107773 RepID=UPI00300B972B
MTAPDIELPSNRKFGLFFSVVFLIAGYYFWGKETQWLSYIFLSLSPLFVVVSLLKPDLLEPLNKLWMRFGLLLGMIVSPIVLGIMFFGLISPIALLMRLFGRDELRLKLVEKKSHWIERSSDSAKAETFKHQF